MMPLDHWVRQAIRGFLADIDGLLSCDTMIVLGPILPGLDDVVRRALGPKASGAGELKEKLSVILDTPGGVVEVAERIVHAFHCRYKSVTFIVPDRAMSAGTLMVLSGDQILMDSFSVLGPIDPQVEKNGRLIPATSYLLMYDRLRQLATKGELTNADLILLEKLDLGELHWFEQARALSEELAREWLYNYLRREPQRHEMKSVPEEIEARANEIAKSLCDIELWHSHSRGISAAMLLDKLLLDTDDLAANPALATAVRGCFDLARDYKDRHNMPALVESRLFS